MRVKVWSRVPSLSALRRSTTLVNNKWAELRPFTFVIIGDTCSLTVTVYHSLLFSRFVWTILNIARMSSSFSILISQFLLSFFPTLTLCFIHDYKSMRNIQHFHAKCFSRIIYFLYVFHNNWNCIETLYKMIEFNSV